MTAGGSPTLGDIQNKETVRDKKEGDVAASTSLTAGRLVYQDGANGWKLAPVDGSILARAMYFNSTLRDNSSGAKGDLTATFYGEGAIVVGEADGAIVVGQKCRASQTAAHLGIFQANAEPADATTTPTAAQLNALKDYINNTISIYLGHSGEITETNNDPTDATDAQTNCLFLIVRN